VNRGIGLGQGQLPRRRGGASLRPARSDHALQPSHYETPYAAGAGEAKRAVASEDGLALGGPVVRSRGSMVVRAVPEARADRDLLAGLRDRLPEGAIVGGPAAERLDLESMLSLRTIAR
jgi:hypothetical protein